MKYRGSSKIKHQHHMIQGLRSLLEIIETWPEIRAITPGAISRTKGSASGLRLSIQYETNTGLKCIARRPGTIQEVFIVTAAPDVVKSRLTSMEHSR